MTDATFSPGAERPRAGSMYRTVWRWHFLASLYVLPFMALLSLTGALYLYQAPIEERLYADRLNVTPAAEPATLEAQTAAVDASRVRSILVTGDPGRSTVIEHDDAQRVRTVAWVDPGTAQVIATEPRDAMLMQRVRKLHGELLLGAWGTKAVELAAHWAVVMMITGLYLWWPRGGRTLAQQAAPPRGPVGARATWRQAHLFTGVLAVALVLPILVSGLPWTDAWGGGFSRVQDATGQASRSLRFGGGAPGSTTSEGETIPHASVIETARAEGLSWPLEMRPPRDAEAAFWVRSAALPRSEQTELVVDQHSGAVLARMDFADNPPVARAVSWGISFHQGEAYGWLNRAQNTLAALVAFALAVSGFVAWWMRRPEGRLGVPEAPERAMGWPMAALVVTLGVVLPLVGASLSLALALERLVFRHLGWFGAGGGARDARL